MTDLQGFVESLIKAGKTEIGSTEESKNLSIPQREILAGYLFKNDMEKEGTCSDIEVLIADYLISQSDEVGQLFLKKLKEYAVNDYIDEIKLILKEGMKC